MADPILPGLEELTPAPTDGPMVRSARVSLEALRQAGSLETRHAVLVQLVLSLAGAIDRGVVAGRASAVAMAAKQLLETMIVLDPPPPDGDAATAARTALAQFVADIEKYANAHD